MTEDSMWARFDPSAPGWLRTRQANGQYVSADDVARIVAANPGEIPNPVMREFVLKGLRGELKKRAGRPKRGSRGELRLLLAAHYVEVLTRWLKRAKARGYHSYQQVLDSQVGLSEHVHEVVARRLKLGTGAALANAISDQKNNRPYLQDIPRLPGVTVTDLHSTRRSNEQDDTPSGAEGA